MNQTARQTETQVSQTDSQVGKRIVTVLFGLAEVILAFRLLFKLFAANPDNGFVKGLYAITQPVVGIFEGIFGKPSANGSVLEPATLIVMVIVGLLAWGILKLMSSTTSHRVEKTQSAPLAENPQNVRYVETPQNVRYVQNPQNAPRVENPQNPPNDEPRV